MNGADTMHGAYLGPRYGDAEITSYLDRVGAVYERIDDGPLARRLADILAGEAVVGGSRGAWNSVPVHSARALSSATRAAARCSP